MTAPFLRQMLAAVGTPVIRFASRAYVPGPHLDDAMKWALRMQQRQMACTLGYFDAPGDTAEVIAQQAIGAARALHALGGDGFGYVSVKVPPMQYDLAHLNALCDRARAFDQFVHFDSHGPETADPTIAAMSSLLGPGRKLSLTLPGRWTRSIADAAWAAHHQVRIRIVKGQWLCPLQPDRDMTAGFLEVVDRVAGRARSVAVASHDAPLAREALTRLLSAGTPCELELICGLPRRAPLAVARELGVPVRLYIPFGQAWLPYALQQAVRNPKTFGRLLKDTFNAAF